MRATILPEAIILPPLCFLYYLFYVHFSLVLVLIPLRGTCYSSILNGRHDSESPILSNCLPFPLDRNHGMESTDVLN